MRNRTLREFVVDAEFQERDGIVYYSSFHQMEELCLKYGLKYFKTPFKCKNGERNDYFIDKTHMNARGQKVCAELIFSFLKNEINAESKVYSLNLDSINKFTPNISMAQKNNNLDLSNSELRKYVMELSRYRKRGRIGAVVMNCNPFTLGHHYLIKTAASQVDHLFVFIVGEDKSYFKFADRYEMVKCGTIDVKNLTIIPSGKFILSALTFNSYFTKDKTYKFADPSLDILVFCNYIAPALEISIRFAGEEPFDTITSVYNKTMEVILPQYGIEFTVIPRIAVGYSDEIISASAFRRRILEKNLDINVIKKLVPQTTIAYLEKHNLLK